MQNSNSTQKTVFHSFSLPGFGVDIVRVHLQTRLDLSTDPLLLSHLPSVHFYVQKGSKEQRDVQGANEREIDSQLEVTFSLFMCLRPHLPHVRLNKTP